MAATTQPPIRRRYRVSGVVQGVGFRWHVHDAATPLGVTGFVMNHGRDVVIEVEGSPDEVDRFGRAVVEEPPRLARIERIEAEDVAVEGSGSFEIRGSC